MNGMIPWSELSGDTVERIMAAYICLENPDCIHVRPSVGDAGIDVIRSLGDNKIEVYQIKKFASSLSPSQKSQVKKSWERLIKYAQENGLVLVNWYLVMPLDPTRENLRWFKELTVSFETRTCWYGKSHVDAWTAKMPYVADYYIDGNKNATLTIAKELLEAARLPDVTDREGLKSQLVAIQSLLGDIDPNYTYDFQLLHDFDFEAPLVFRSCPGLVVTTIERTKQGGAIKIDVLAKHSAAAELAPISGTFTLFADNDEHKGQLRDYVDFGIPLKSFPAKISTHGEALFTDVDEDCIGTVSMYEHSSSISMHEACLVHVRRKFAEIVKVAGGDAKAASVASVALEARRMIDEMFHIDERFDDMTPENRHCSRLEHLEPEMDEFEAWARVQIDQAVPKMALYAALAYALKYWPYVRNVLNDGRFEPSNNIAERAIRPFAIGRKNFLFSDTQKGAHASAAIYSIVTTAKMNGLNPRLYLEWLLETMPNTEGLEDGAVIDQLLPWSKSVPDSCRLSPESAATAVDMADDPILDIDPEAFDS